MSDNPFINSTEQFVQLEKRMLQTYPQQCVRLRHRKATCSRCADSCPTKAITWGETLEVDLEKCTSCGVCAEVCPTGAIEAVSPSNEEIVREIEFLAKGTPHITFACPKVGGRNGRGVIRVNCIGRVDASILFFAAAAGIQKVELVDCMCTGCLQHSGRETAGEAAAKAKALLQACGVEPIIDFTNWSVHLDQADFRGFDTTRAANTTGTPGSTPYKLPKGELPIRRSAKNEIILGSLKKMAGRVCQKELDAGLWATVKIKPGCTGCQMCAFFCPTGALIKVMDDGKPGLAFKTAECTACHLCGDVCYTSSIEISPIVDFLKVVDQTIETIWADKQTSSRQEKLNRLRMFR